MERYRGHLYNWYDTATLAAAPAAVRLDRRQRQSGRPPARAQAGLRRVAEPRWSARRGSTALRDTLELLRGGARGGQRQRTRDRARRAGRELAARAAAEPAARPVAWRARSTRSRARARRLARSRRDRSCRPRCAGSPAAVGGPATTPRFWAEATVAPVASTRDELDALAPGRRSSTGAARRAEAVLARGDAMPRLADLADRGARAIPRWRRSSPARAALRSARRRRRERRPRRAAVALASVGRAAGDLARACAGLASGRVADGDGLRARLRPDAAPVLDRLQRRPTAGSTRRTTTCSPPRRGWRASSRSPRARCRRRTGSASAAACPRRRRSRAALLERHDVRVPDAAAGDAPLPARRCSTRPTRRWSRARSSTARGAACRGASPSRPTTPSTWR